ncbi:MAG: ATP-binding cassette domain-containing protein, partial [Bdellovibrionales bacterium]|nr:ATP-binding cassette domain-containing protein [Bdellovibrionales bacterium]
YRLGERSVDVLRDLNFRVEEGEFTAIQGPSGSGKSTLFYILGGLLRAQSGRLLLDGEDITNYSRDQLALLRNAKIGFVFQQFHLLPGATVLENILLPCRYPLESARITSENVARARELAQELGIFEHLEHKPNQLSGGQQQRVAIARALMKDSKLILADEPTGALDSKSAAQTLEILSQLNRRGKTVLIITHDNEVAAQCRRVLHMRDGVLVTNADTALRALPASPVSSVAPPATVRNTGRLHSLGALVQLMRASLPTAVENILRSRVKSLLTMLGVIIGVAAVLAMTTLGNFAKSRILESYESLGVNKMGIGGYSNWNMRASDKVGIVFRFFDVGRDINPLPQIFPEIHLLSPMNEAWGVSAFFGGASLREDVRLQGANEQYFAISNRALAKGIPFTFLHVQNRNAVCVIGSDIQARLFKSVEPVGKFVNISMDQDTSFPCRVLGVMAPRVSNNEWEKPNSLILVPHTFLQTFKSDGYHQIALQAYPGTDIEKAGKKIKAYFEQKYGKSGRFWVDSDSALIDQMKRFLNIFSLLLGSIAGLSLLVGGIGINNMMLVSISERLREIGLRKALGATDRSLRYQIITESMCLCLVAGVMGIVGGFVVYEGLIYGVSFLVPKVKFAWVFEPWAILLSALSMVVVGVASGFVPAVKAQKLEVIEALRSE